MRVFQFVRKVPYYINHFENKYKDIIDSLSYQDMLELYLNDRFYSAHILYPILKFDWENAAFVIWDYERIQKKWAEENNLIFKSLLEILYAQIENFKPDVIYNLHPISLTSKEIKSVPGSPLKLCWFAAPLASNQSIDFKVYDARLTNVPFDIKSKEEVGFMNFLFNPAHDPAMDKFAKNEERPIDVLFYGQYLPSHFERRNDYLLELVKLKDEGVNLVIALRFPIQYKNYVPSGAPNFIRKMFRSIDFPPKLIRKKSIEPVFGIDVYSAISQSKIVFNASVDFSGKYKVNMRNFESLGCGAHLISDEGIYPEGLIADKDFSIYTSMDDFKMKARYFLDNINESRDIAKRGHKTVTEKFSKDIQWDRFKEIVSDL